MVRFGGFGVGGSELLKAKQLAIEAARAADGKKAIDVCIQDMREAIGITDYFVICSGKTDRQVNRIQDAIEERLKRKGAKPARREGERFGRWVLLDYIDIVIHIFREEERLFYGLERLWQDVPLVDWNTDGST